MFCLQVGGGFQWHFLSLTFTDRELKDTHLTLNDTERIGDELTKLHDTYKTAIKTMNDYKKQLEAEKSDQTETNWEFEHQTKRRTNFEAQIAKLSPDITALRYSSPMIGEICFTILTHHENVKSIKCFYSFRCLCHLLLFSLATADGCRHCPPGWILMNSVCYYFSYTDDALSRTWQRARDFCQIYGGDLAVIDSKDKEVDNQNLINISLQPCS